jgi:hypothetical protein
LSSECAKRDLASSRRGLVVWGVPGLRVLGGVAFPSVVSKLRGDHTVEVDGKAGVMRLLAEGATGHAEGGP